MWLNGNTFESFRSERWHRATPLPRGAILCCCAPPNLFSFAHSGLLMGNNFAQPLNRLCNHSALLFIVLLSRLARAPPNNTQLSRYQTGMESMLLLPGATSQMRVRVAWNGVNPNIYALLCYRSDKKIIEFMARGSATSHKIKWGRATALCQCRIPPCIEATLGAHPCPLHHNLSLFCWISHTK